MLYRKVPKNGDLISSIGYGCMRYPGSTFRIDEKRTISQIRQAIDLGINYFDTAWPYHNGNSEIILGKALKDGYRQKVKIADKLPHWMCSSAAQMEEKLNIQLERLGVDCIDYYLIHNLDGASWKNCLDNGVIEFLDKARADGKIINPGFSFHGSTADFPVIVDGYDWVFAQIQYNILDKYNQAGINGLEYAKSKNLAVMIMEPLRGGVLADRLPDSVASIYDSAPQKRENVEWALKWILHQEGVTTVLSGMNEESHIDQNARIAEESPPQCLSDEEIAVVEQVAKKYREIQKVPCTACQYCMPCPSGVNIPMVFSYFNGWHLFRERVNRIQYLMFLGGVLGRKKGIASLCTDCKVCVKKCPQHINIPCELKKAEEEFETFFGRLLIRIVGFFYPGEK